MEAYYVEGVLEKAAYIHPSTTMPTCTYVGTCRIFYFVFALGTYVRMRAHDAAILPMIGRGASVLYDVFTGCGLRVFRGYVG